MADKGDQDRYIHLKEISIDLSKRRPTSDVQLVTLVFKDDAGVKHKSDKCKEGDLIYWNLDMYVRTNTRATLIIWQAPSARIAEISVEFKPNEFGDNRAVGLEDCNFRVYVNFVCGRSEPPEFFLGSRARTGLASIVPGFLRLPQLAVPALPPPTSGRGYDVPYPVINLLNNDTLLGIFDSYRLDEENCWNDRLGWRKLFHVCQRWRYLIYESTFHLGMHIRCTNGTPIVDKLDHLPPLPLVVHYYTDTYRDATTLMEKDKLGLYNALRLHDRVRHIDLNIPLSISHKVLLLMDKHFPILEYLRLSFTAESTTILTLPKAFLAPNLGHLALHGITPPRRFWFFTSTVSLVGLELRNIQTSGYFRPGLIVTYLSSLPQLELLSIEFSVPIPGPSNERELLGEQGIPVTLPSLQTLWFTGVSAYLESLVAQIRVPLLNTLIIRLFNQNAFALPHLSHLLDITEGSKQPQAPARVQFYRDSVGLLVGQIGSPCFYFYLWVYRTQWDWQIDCAAKICSALITTLSGVEELKLGCLPVNLPAEWENRRADGTRWYELLKSFISVKQLRVESGLVRELSRALEANDEVGSEPAFLPDLQSILGKPLSIHANCNLFASFINTRRATGRPVHLSLM